MRKGVRRKIGLIVNDVEAAGLLEQVREMTKLPDLGVDRRIVIVGGGSDAIQTCRGDAVERREERDIHPPRDEGFGQQARHKLPWPIMAWRRAPGDRRQHRDPHYPPFVLRLRMSPSSGSKHPSIERPVRVERSSSSAWASAGIGSGGAVSPRFSATRRRSLPTRRS